MSSYRVNKLLFDVYHDPARAERYKKEEMTVLDEYRLKAEEVIAFKNADARALYDLGASPLLLIPGLMAIKAGPKLIFNLTTRFFGLKNSPRMIGIIIESFTAKFAHKRYQKTASKTAGSTK